MSTRCQIKVIYSYGSELDPIRKSALIYQHWDGYPEGVGFDLIQRQKELKTWNGAAIVNNLIKDARAEYEFAFSVHTDIDYWYEIDCDKKTIRCWRVAGFNLSDHAEVRKGEETDFSKIIKKA